AQGFQDHNKAMWLEYLRALAKCRNYMSGLNAYGKFSLIVAGYNGYPLCIHTFGDLNGVPAALEKNLHVVRIARCQRIRAVAALVDHEDSHLHPEFVELLADFF